LFDYACEAVINDIISAHFAGFTLPDSPIRGVSLVGRDVSTLSAEQVLQLLRSRGWRQEITGGLMAGTLSDDHSVWDIPGSDETVGDEEGDPVLDAQREGWTHETDEQVTRIVSEQGAQDAYGSTPLGQSRLVLPTGARKDLRRYLLSIIKPSARYRTFWNRPPRKSMSLYPEVILPYYEPETRLRRILMAVDASGSIPDQFLSDAVHVAQQRIPCARVTIITFDTTTYEWHPGAGHVRGGGGTRVQAVEEYACGSFDEYPDLIFVLSDGFTPKPTPIHPERWIWILPPWGSASAVPESSKVEYFDAAERRQPRSGSLCRRAVRGGAR
jgi:predicted metal-dependent peptidase